MGQGFLHIQIYIHTHHLFISSSLHLCGSLSLSLSLSLTHSRPLSFSLSLPSTQVGYITRKSALGCGDLGRGNATKGNQQKQGHPHELNGGAVPSTPSGSARGCARMSAKGARDPLPRPTLPFPVRVFFQVVQGGWGWQSFRPSPAVEIGGASKRKIAQMSRHPPLLAPNFPMMDFCANPRVLTCRARGPMKRGYQF
jgi:hypothetical protein